MGSKATLIEKACNIRLGEDDLCSEDISDMFTFYQTSEGFIIPKSMLRDHEIEITFMDEDERKAFESHLTEQERIRQQEVEAEKARREAMRREAAEKKRKEKYKDQTDLFGDTSI